MKRYHSDKMPLKQYMYILNLTVKKNIKQQYRNSTLGIIWTVLNPLLNMLVMAFVFSTIFGRGSIHMDYSCYILSGNIIFGLMRQATSSSLTCIVDSRDLMTKTRVPTTTFILSRTVTALSNFGFSLIALIFVMIVQYINGSQVFFSFYMLLAFLALPALFMFSLGIGFILATIYVKFRDIKHIYSVVLTLWNYLTPIFYSVDLINSDLVKKVLNLNPMTGYVTFFRNIFIAGGSADWMMLLIGYAWGIAMLLVGVGIFQASKKNFVVNL